MNIAAPLIQPRANCTRAARRHFRRAHLELRRIHRPRGAPRPRSAQPAGPRPECPRRAVHGEPTGVSGNCLRLLDRRTDGGAGEREIAWPRGGPHRARQRRGSGGHERRAGRRHRDRAAGRRRAVPADHRRRQRRLREAAAGARRRLRDARAQSHRVDLLHQRHHRSPEGRDADAPQPDLHEPGLLRRHRTRSSRVAPSCTPRRCRTARASTACHTCSAVGIRWCYRASTRPKCSAPSSATRTSRCSPRRRW